MTTPYRLITCGILLAALPLGAQSRRDRDRAGDRADADEDLVSRIDTTLSFDARGTVDLTLVSGDIIVTAWARTQVQVHATSEGGTLRLDASASHLLLDVRGERRNLGDTRFEVTVPVGARVLARGTSANVRVRGVKGGLELRSVSGDIDVADGGDRLVFESVSGSVRGDRVGGSVRGTSVSGDVELSGIVGDADVETVSGGISLIDVQSKNVRTKTVSGDVTFRGAIDPDGRYDFHAHSGDLRLTIPRDASVTFDVATFSGSVHSSFPLILPPGDHEIGVRTKHYEFSVGTGRARVSAETFSGDITFERAGR